MGLLHPLLLAKQTLEGQLVGPLTLNQRVCGKYKSNVKFSVRGSVTGAPLGGLPLEDTRPQT